MKKISVTKIFKFEMAHQLDSCYSDECKKIHGHSYKLEVTVSNDLNNDGMVIDFKQLKEIVQPIVDYFDHNCIKSDGFFGINPTAENMASWIFRELNSKLKFLEKIRLWETDTCYVDVTY